ncbi:MAG TPA: hypothetical protein VK136_08265 [Bacillota bacterium]|nr:hypothetical protein [Bacillota bacterium]
MKIIPAAHAPKMQLRSFLDTNNMIDEARLLAAGYVVEMKGRLEGCFVLEAIDSDVYWLKQMYMTKNAALSLPGLLEAVLALAKQKQAQTVYVYSHQLFVDIILEALQFHPQEKGIVVDNDANKPGNWWAYNVS